MSKSVLVIGVRGGVGNAVAQQLINEGCTVIGTVRSADQLAEVQDTLPGLADLFVLDFADADSIVQTLSPYLEDIDLAGIIICAAICDYSPLELESLAKVRYMLEVNTIANLAIYQASMPTLRRSQGRLVIVNSHSGLITFPFLGTYQASKFALEAFADVMRLEAAKWGVRVVLIEPGGMDTGMSRGMGQSLPERVEQLSDEHKELYKDLYDGFRDLLSGSHEMTPLPEVASVVVSALYVEDPEPRYLVGKDTDVLVAKKRELSDREWDSFARSVYGLS